MATKTEKDSKAKAEVDKLLAGVTTKARKRTTKKPATKKTTTNKSVKKSDSNEWLQSQLDEANIYSKKLEDMLQAKTDDLAKLSERYNQLKDGDNSSDGKLLQGVVSLFKDIENHHLGRNNHGPQGKSVKYTEIGLKQLIEKMLRTFPSLVEMKQKGRL